MFAVLPLYLGLGALAGVLAGLLGIGGGLVIVPMLLFALERQGVAHELVMHLALGTSLASIIFTAASSACSHHRRGAVHWKVVARITPGILCGTLVGTFIAASRDTALLKLIFVLFLYLVAIRMLTNHKPNPTRKLPGRGGMFAAGGVIGAISSLVGIGGGTISTPFLLRCNTRMHQAIGTSAAMGVPIALAGTIGYIYNGFNIPRLPPYSLGFVYLPALLGIVSASTLTAPLGVRLAHSLPVATLKRIFALLLIAVATRMLF